MLQKGQSTIIQKDITEFQFAKAAIAAGLKILAKNCYRQKKFWPIFFF